MSPPQPPVEPHDHCSVIYNNTLYVYSPDAFQSLTLSEGATWEELSMGVSVTGAACVNATPEGDNSQAALYVVGGSTNSSTVNYSGLQRYNFADRTWQSISPVVPVTQNRRNHGAAYLNSSQSILIYAGTQDGNVNQASSQTFLVSTNAPFTVTSFSSSKAPPLVAPLLLPWDSRSAVLVGGSESNKQAYTFGPEAGWTVLDATLDKGLPDRSQVQGIIVNGDDGSKMLETFNMAVLPNTVTRTCLSCKSDTGASQPAITLTASKPGSSDAPPAKRRKRELTATSWPKYDGTLAPKVARTNYTLAQAPNGYVVALGGNTEDPLCMFNYRENSWLNASQILTGKADAIGTQSFQDPTFPSASSTSQIPTASATSQPMAATGASTSRPNKARLLTILGGTLGGVLGLAILVALLMLFLRWRRNKKEHFEAGHLRRASGIPGEEKGRMSFADRGANFMREAGGFISHSHSGSVNSESSHAIITGRVFKGQKGHKRGLFSKSGNSSFGSGFFNKSSKAQTPLRVDVSAPRPLEKAVSFALTTSATAPVPGPRIPGTSPIPRPPRAPVASADGDGKQRSSGWSRYFSGNTGVNLINMNSERSTYIDDGQETEASQSQYTDSRIPSQGIRESMTVPPLHYGRFSSGENINRVASSSPNIGHPAADTRGTGLALTNGLSAEVQRSHSQSTVSSAGREDAFSSGIPASIHEPLPWSPVSREHNGSERATSSIYTDSARNTTIPRESSTTFLMPDQDDPLPAFSDGRRNHSDMSWLNLGGSAKA